MATMVQIPQTSVFDTNNAWEQVLRREPDADFVYGVITTGVFCRPDCASRRPLRENVRFFANAAEAQAAGFRPCQRCTPGTPQLGERLATLVRAHIDAHFDRAVPLGELASLAGLSPFTVQRLFKQSTGVTPLQYQRALRQAKLRDDLKSGETVTTAIYASGYGSPSRAHRNTGLGMTPSRYAKGGKGETIRWITGQTPLGPVAIATTERGLCWLAFVESDKAEASLRTEFPAATLIHDPNLAPTLKQVIASALNTAKPTGGIEPPLDLRGTAFQLRVWEALRKIPRGQTRSYSALAAELGNANATRAVARACATNRVAVLVPCHRVVGLNGSLTGYRWGVERKKALLQQEQKPLTTQD